jgi:hypothetical protein
MPRIIDQLQLLIDHVCSTKNEHMLLIVKNQNICMYFFLRHSFSLAKQS